MSSRVQRLGKNSNGYAGETIDIAAVLKDCITGALAHSWTIEELAAGTNRSLLALSRPGSRITNHHSRIYISTGIHWHEPAGPLPAPRLFQDRPSPTGAHL